VSGTVIDVIIDMALEMGAGIGVDLAINIGVTGPYGRSAGSERIASDRPIGAVESVVRRAGRGVESVGHDHAILTAADVAS
jgi:hypothetical protein